MPLILKIIEALIRVNIWNYMFKDDQSLSETNNEKLNILSIYIKISG